MISKWSSYFLRLKPFPNLSKDGLGKAQRPGFLSIFPSTKPDLLHKSIPSPKFLEVFPKSLKNIQNHKHVPNIYPNLYPDIDPTSPWSPCFRSPQKSPGLRERCPVLRHGATAAEGDPGALRHQDGGRGSVVFWPFFWPPKWRMHGFNWNF